MNCVIIRVSRLSQERTRNIGEYFYGNETTNDKEFTTKNSYTGFATVLRALCAIRPLIIIIESHQCENCCLICGLRRIIESLAESHSSLDYEIEKFEENFKIAIDKKTPEEVFTYILADKAFDLLNRKKCKLKYEITLAHGRSIGKVIKQKHGFINLDVNQLVVPIPDYSIFYNDLPPDYKIRTTNFIESRQSLIGKITNNMKKSLSTHKYSINTGNYDSLLPLATASIAPELLAFKINWGFDVPILNQIFQLLIQLPDKINITVDSAQISYGLRLLFVSKEDSTYLIAHGDYWEKIENNSRLLIGNGQWYDNILFILYTHQVPVMVFYEKGYNQEFALSDNQLVILESLSIRQFDEVTESIYEQIVNPEIYSRKGLISCSYCGKDKLVNEFRCITCGFSFSSWICSNGHQNWPISIGCHECGEVKAEVINYRKNHPQRTLNEDAASKCCTCKKQTMPNRTIFAGIDEYCKSCLLMNSIDQVKIYV